MQSNGTDPFATGDDYELRCRKGVAAATELLTVGTAEALGADEVATWPLLLREGRHTHVQAMLRTIREAVDFPQQLALKAVIHIEEGVTSDVLSRLR